MSSRQAWIPALATVAGVALAVPAPAFAHSRAPTIALDVKLRVDSIPGVRAKVIDGNRRLRLTVDPGVTLIVRGLLGEPVLRFGRDGVWANLDSPTAVADRISSRRGSGWIRLTPGRFATFAGGSIRTWTASLIGTAAIVLTLRQVVVFWHGVVISSLSPPLVRLAVATAIAGGFAAAAVSFTADDGPKSRSVAADDARRSQDPA